MTINFDRLTDENFIMFAMQHYDNPQCVSIDDFHEDLLKIKYLKRLLNRYKDLGELRERLIINHLIVLYNVFGVEAATKMLFYKIDPSLWSIMKTFLVYLHYMPERVIGVFEKDIISSDIPVVQEIATVLREI